MRYYILNSSLCAEPDDPWALRPVRTPREFDYFMQGNSGNTLIAESLRRLADGTAWGHHPNMWRMTPDEIPVDRINAECGLLVMCMQDQIQPGMVLRNVPCITEVLDRIRIPKICLSLGANALAGTPPKAVADGLQPSVTEFVRHVMRTFDGVSVRGEFTAEVMRLLGFGDCAVHGCPSYYRQGPGRRAAPAAVPDPALPPERRRYIIGTGLYSVRNTTVNLSYLLQSEKPLISLTQGWDTDLAGLQRDFSGTYPHYAATVLSALCKRHGLLFFHDPAHWVAHIAKYGWVAAGTRFHGAVAALNAGVPAVVTNGDARAKELCDLTGIPLYPGWSMYDFPPEKLAEMAGVTEVNARYDGLYESFMKWLGDFGLRAPAGEAEPDSLPPFDGSEGPRAGEAVYYLAELLKQHMEGSAGQLDKLRQDAAAGRGEVEALRAELNERMRALEETFRRGLDALNAEFAARISRLGK